MISSNVAGYTKKQLTAAVVFIGFCIGNAVGPQTFIDKEARSFPLSFISLHGLSQVSSSMCKVLLKLTKYSEIPHSLQSDVDRLQHEITHGRIAVCAYVDVQYEKRSKTRKNAG